MKIAVVMTYYNEVDIVGDAVDALVNNGVPFDLYLIDDCSTKPPQYVLNKYANEPWLHYVRNETNIGGAAGLNKGIKLALNNGSELIAINDADDISYPNRLKDQMSAFQADKDLMILGGAADFVDFEAASTLWREQHPETNDAIHRHNQLNSTFVHSTVMYRAEVFEKVGFYDPKAYALDYDFITRVLANKYKAANLPNVLLKYNIRPGSMSVSKRRTQVASRLKVQLSHFNLFSMWSYVGVARSLLAYLSPDKAATNVKTFFYRLSTDRTG